MSYQCDNKHSIKLTVDKSLKLGMNNIPVPCGKCYNCKKRRVAQWSFRLQKELERSTSAYFVTLTYDNYHVPIVKGRYPMTLVKNSDQNKELADSGEKQDRSLQAFFKRLRYYEEKFKIQYQPKIQKLVKQIPIRYYACGEYGSLPKRQRPHYHIILFNVADINSIYKAWSTAKMADDNMEVEEWIPFGNVDISEDVNVATIQYCLKYINKTNKKVGTEKNDNRIPEFPLMSKGLGSNWITPELEKFYNSRLDVSYLVNQDGYKIPIPKYYLDKMMTEETREDRAGYIKRSIEEAEKKSKETEKQKVSRKFGRQALMNNYSKRNID